MRRRRACGVAVSLTSGLIGTTLRGEPVLSPAARRRQGTFPFATCARRGLRRRPRLAHAATVEFGDVFILQETRLALHYRIGKASHWVARRRLQQRPGAVGVLVLPWDFAVERSLVPYEGVMTDERPRPLCDGRRLDSLPCRSAQRPGSRFCFFHDPMTAREREAAPARGPARSIVRDASPSTS
jgi:hypothetical protein